DEPCLVQDRTPEELAALERAYARLSKAAGAARLWVQTYYGHVGDSYQTLVALPVAAIGLDLVRGTRNLDLLQQHGFRADKPLAAGVVDGRNIWATDLDAALAPLERIRAVVPHDRLVVTPSCSLLHVPYDARLETDLDGELRGWLAFAEQKLD